MLNEHFVTLVTMARNLLHFVAHHIPLTVCAIINARRKTPCFSYGDIRRKFVLRGEFKALTTRLPSLWTNSYFVSTAGGAPLAAIKQYIENQERDQRKRR